MGWAGIYSFLFYLSVTLTIPKPLRACGAWAGRGYIPLKNTYRRPWMVKNTNRRPWMLLFVTLDGQFENLLLATYGNFGSKSLRALSVNGFEGVKNNF